MFVIANFLHRKVTARPCYSVLVC
uniref:Uncharacterized protein n=1 Tax=Arundo donax TaxID=35708 RepID=A0A0A9A3G7_ARUDO